MAEPLKAGGDVRKNWRTINELRDAISAAETELRTLSGKLRALRGAAGGQAPAHAFAVRQQPASDEEWVESDWLHVVVSGGNVNTTEVTGTAIDVPEPAGEEPETYYVWLTAVTSLDGDGNVTVESVDINHGADGWDGWPNQPDWDDPPGPTDTQETHVLVAEIEADPGTLTLTIRQNVRGDLALWLAGQGCVDDELVRRLRWAHPDQTWP